MEKRSLDKVTFTEKEVKFLKESKLARIATVSPSGQPHVVPVAFEFDGKYFYVGGYNLTKSLKFKNIQRNNKVALVVDDLVSTDPWTPRFLLVRGTAEIVDEKKSGEDVDIYIKISPSVKRSSKTLSR
ncbi:MAG: PPOX class F420-dependent oxidoreductase [Nitrososphaerales archaeon]